MERRKFTREFKLEAVRLIKERGVLEGAGRHHLLRDVVAGEDHNRVVALSADPR